MEFRVCFLLVALLYHKKSVAAEVSPEYYPRLEGPNYAGREFVFTFGDNRPVPIPVLFIAPYNHEDSVSCNITYYLGEKTKTEKIDVSGKGVLLDAPTELLMRVASGNISDLLDFKSIHITADAEVVVYGFSDAVFSTDAFTALPTDVLGLEYVIPSSAHTYTNIVVSSMIVVTGVCTNRYTNVNFVFPTRAGFYHPKTKVWQTASQLNLSIRRHQTISLLADVDLTGTKVTSDCDVAVMSGNKKGSISGTTGDHMYEMIPPISRLGRTYITTPLIRRTTGDVYTLIGARDGTTCKISKLGISDGAITVIELNTGEKYTMDIASDQYTKIDCTTSVLLAQYAKSGMNNTWEAGYVKYGDPFMTLVPSIIQFDSVYTLSCLQPVRFIKTPFDHYISILIQDEHISGLQIDGQYMWRNNGTSTNSSSDITVVKLHSIEGVAYSHIVLSVLDGVHRLEHDNPTVTFGVMVYGLKRSESYGYPGGMRLTLSGPDCLEDDTVVNDNNNNDCDWLVDEELLDGIDNDGDGRIDEDLAANQLYPVIDTLRQVSHTIDQLINAQESILEEKEDEQGRGDAWAITLTAILVALALLCVVIALIFYISRRVPASNKAYVPAEFRNRYSGHRISIRSVWTGKKNKTEHDDDSRKDGSSDGASQV